MKSQQFLRTRFLKSILLSAVLHSSIGFAALEKLPEPRKGRFGIFIPSQALEYYEKFIQALTDALNEEVEGGYIETVKAEQLREVLKFYLPKNFDQTNKLYETITRLWTALNDIGLPPQQVLVPILTGLSLHKRHPQLDDLFSLLGDVESIFQNPSLPQNFKIEIVKAGVYYPTVFDNRIELFTQNLLLPHIHSLSSFHAAKLSDSISKALRTLLKFYQAVGLGIPTSESNSEDTLTQIFKVSLRAGNGFQSLEPNELINFLINLQGDPSFVNSEINPKQMNELLVLAGKLNVMQTVINTARRHLVETLRNLDSQDAYSQALRTLQSDFQEKMQNMFEGETSNPDQKVYFDTPLIVNFRDTTGYWLNQFAKTMGVLPFYDFQKLKNAPTVFEVFLDPVFKKYELIVESLEAEHKGYKDHIFDLLRVIDCYLFERTLNFLNKQESSTEFIEYVHALLSKLHANGQ